MARTAFLGGHISQVPAQTPPYTSCPDGGNPSVHQAIRGRASPTHRAHPVPFWLPPPTPTLDRGQVRRARLRPPGSQARSAHPRRARPPPGVRAARRSEQAQRGTPKAPSARPTTGQRTKSSRNAFSGEATASPQTSRSREPEPPKLLLPPLGQPRSGFSRNAVPASLGSKPRFSLVRRADPRRQPRAGASRRPEQAPHLCKSFQ